MNPYNGELRRLAAGEDPPEDFERLPTELDKIAQLRMARAAQGESVNVNLSSVGPLARWARDRRKEKRKAKIAAVSRRRNRGKR